GLHTDYVVYLIAIPFIAYCAIAIVTEIMIRKELAIKKEKKRRKENVNKEYKGAKIAVLS
ncbi:hypothetical protein JGH11_15305, partial [Dysgonomonas sp. Marseille-P4677]|nr:hypothetical protein [Dysgonomonas sp. Marseille-P4677]